ncbi:MAG TPA: DUF58 domain-containing protein [Chloroflexota bacterium]
MAQTSQLNPHTYFGFDGAFLRKLERLALLTRRPMPGPAAGPRRSPRHGASVEFADFRDYSPGDDFRRIDWNALARLDRLFLRLYSAEEMTTVTVCLDHSSSMTFGQPSKALTAARLAAVMSYIALHADDRVMVAGWSQRIDHYLPAQGGRGAIPRVWSALAEIAESPAGATDFAALRSLPALRRGSGLTIVLSDFLTDTDWSAGLRALRGSAHEVSVVQILAPEELNPTLRGDWKLRDVESEREIEITISPRVLRRYEEELAAHTAALRELCRRQSMSFVQLPSSISLEDVALSALRAAGVIGS